NAPPQAIPDQITVLQDSKDNPLQLRGCDPEDAELTFEVLWATPATPGRLEHGWLDDAGDDKTDTWEYTPDTSYTGPDQFEFRVSDGQLWSLPATFDITVIPEKCDLQPINFRITEEDYEGECFCPGTPVSLAWDGRNNGPGDTVDQGEVDWTDAVYFSTDQVLDAGDRLLRSSPVQLDSPLEAGQTYPAAVTVTLPNDLSVDGPYYLIVHVDSGDDQLETTEENNTAVLGLCVKPFVQMTAPICGIFVEPGMMIDVGWRDAAEDVSALVNVVLDTDTDPTNGYTPLVIGADEDADGDGDSMEVEMPELSHGTYQLYAFLTDSEGAMISCPSEPRLVQMFEKVYAVEDPIGDVVAGFPDDYEIHGIEIGISGDRMAFRIRTDFDPRSRGGDVFIEVDDTLSAVGVSNRILPDGRQITAGNLYVDVDPLPGEVVPWHYRINDWEEELAGYSGIHVIDDVICFNALFALCGWVSLPALGGGDSGTVSWTMWCGNDHVEIIVPFGETAVVDRHIFYNDSAFDGHDAAANDADDNAIDPSKTALLPGETATFANYTSYSAGINGVMLDIAALAGMPTADDFVFKVGNSRDSSSWGTGPNPTNITVRPGEGVAGSFRVTLTWPDHAIEKEWLQVTVLSDANGGSLGLADDDVFYVGNAIGETGNSTFDALVDQHDVAAIEAHTTAVTTLDCPCGADADIGIPYMSPYDIDRDGRVDEADATLASDHMTTPSTRLVLLGQAPPPVVTGVYAASSGWEPKFGDWLHAADMADLDGYYRIPTDTEQLHALPWSGLSQVRLAFSDEVTVEPSDLTLIGTNANELTASELVYDAETCTATWTFDALEADKYRLMLSDAVTATGSGLPLDGDYTDRDGQTASGDTVPGGDFSFRFNVLPGDATHSGNVVAADVSVLASAFGSFASGTSETYSPFVDFDGSGNVVASDVSILASHFGQFLPSGEPTLPANGGTKTAAVEAKTAGATDGDESAVTAVSAAGAAAVLPVPPAAPSTASVASTASTGATDDDHMASRERRD
ncbi:MAG: Ig-like domain-containing protein, partial [Pirellulaceae bacterium]